MAFIFIVKSARFCVVLFNTTALLPKLGGGKRNSPGFSAQWRRPCALRSDGPFSAHQGTCYLIGGPV